MPERTGADLAGNASNTLGDLQDFLQVMIAALCSDLTDLKADQPSAFGTVAQHCLNLATSAREDCGTASDMAGRKGA